jgi:hypothetical protein
MAGAPHSVALVAHPRTPAPGVRTLEVTLREAGHRLQLRYALEGDLTQLRLPPPGNPARRDELWRHTCFEAFLGSAGESGYLEFNFAPGGEWAAYRFDAYRAGMRSLELAEAPAIRVNRAPSRFELEAAVQLEIGRATPARRLALAAVLEHLDGTLSYWSARHPPGQPDFHHPEGFVLELQA